jgi:hypothetical protein
MVSALDGSSPDVVKRDLEIEEERKKAAAAAAEGLGTREGAGAVGTKSKKVKWSRRFQQIAMAVSFAIVSILIMYIINELMD